jgi:hypothetical protein
MITIDFRFRFTFGSLWAGHCLLTLTARFELIANIDAILFEIDVCFFQCHFDHKKDATFIIIIIIIIISGLFTTSCLFISFV